MWLLASIIGYILLAIVFVLDKRILTTEKQTPLVFTFYSAVFLLAAAGGWLFVPLEKSSWYWFMCGVSGLSFVGGLWTMFSAVRKSEASHIDPFIGAVVTIVSFVLASVYLGETLTPSQTQGIFILALASLLFSFEKHRRGKISYQPYAWGIVAGILFGVSNVAAKYVYEAYGFLSGLIGSRFMMGVVGLILLVIPSLWKQLRRPSSKKKSNPVGLVVLDKILGLIGIILLQWATAAGSVTTVNALSGLQYGLMFVIIWTLSHARSKFLHEFMTEREILVQIIALCLIMWGLYAVVF